MLKKHYKKVVFFLVNILVVLGGAWLIKNFSNSSPVMSTTTKNNAIKANANNSTVSSQASGQVNSNYSSKTTRTS